MGDKVQHMISRKYFERVITRDLETFEIGTYISEVQWSIQIFLVSRSKVVPL